MTHDKESVKKMRDYLIKCCYWYYVKNDPIEQDNMYDHLFHDLQAAERELEIEDPDSPTQKIYGERDEEYPEWAKKR